MLLLLRMLLLRCWAVGSSCSFCGLACARECMHASKRAPCMQAGGSGVAGVFQEGEGGTRALARLHRKKGTPALAPHTRKRHGRPKEWPRTQGRTHTPTPSIPCTARRRPSPSFPVCVRQGAGGAGQLLGLFDQNTELWSGRLAMIGFSSLLLIEAIKGESFF